MHTTTTTATTMPLGSRKGATMDLLQGRELRTAITMRAFIGESDDDLGEVLDLIEALAPVPGQAMQRSALVSHLMVLLAILDVEFKEAFEEIDPTSTLVTAVDTVLDVTDWHCLSHEQKLARIRELHEELEGAEEDKDAMVALLQLMALVIAWVLLLGKRAKRGKA